MKVIAGDLETTNGEIRGIARSFSIPGRCCRNRNGVRPPGRKGVEKVEVVKLMRKVTFKEGSTHDRS